MHRCQASEGEGVGREGGGGREGEGKGEREGGREGGEVGGGRDAPMSGE